MNYPLSQEEFRTIYSKVPRLCVDIVVKDNDAVLLTQRKIEPYLGLWHLPGGTVYFGETLEEAVKRVAKDELGIEVEIIGLLGYVEFPDEFKDNWHGWPISLEFEVKLTGGTIAGSDQADNFSFMKFIPSNTVTSHKKFLKEKLGLHQEQPEK